MKYHVTHCGGCGALMLCDKSACARQDHICYWCVRAGNAERQEVSEGPVACDQCYSEGGVKAFGKL